MKTSLKLLLGLAGCLLLTMVAAGWSFRQQYNQLDHADPFAQFSRQPLPTFRVLKVVGNQGEKLLLQPGPAPLLRIRPDSQNEVTFRTIGDTLLIRYQPDQTDATDSYDDLNTGDAMQFYPGVVISAPALQAVVVERATCKVANWKTATLTLTQTGHKGAFALGNNTIGVLHATVAGNGVLSAEDKNSIGQATVLVNGNARFLVGRTAFAALTLRADSSAMLMLPGALLAKIK